MSDDQATGPYGAGHGSATLSDVLLADQDLLRQCTIERVARGGPGGQHANKTASGVRLRHRSGLVVEASEHREGAANRAAALQRLRLACGPAARSWPAVAAVLLDLLHAHGGELKAAAAAGGLSTTQMARALVADPPVRQAADALRARAGLSPLRA